MEESINPQAEHYLAGLYREPDPVRQEMEQLAAERDFPIVGPLVGRQMYQLARMIGARRVFELGSGYGYSALWFARAVGPGGEVNCTEYSDRNISRAQEFLERAGVWDRVVCHPGDALEALRAAGGTYDVIFCDIDKHSYPQTVDLAYAHLRPGGLFMTDNVLWHGHMYEDPAQDSADTAGVREFTRRLFAHSGFITTIIPVRDGLAVALRS